MSVNFSLEVGRSGAQESWAAVPPRLPQPTAPGRPGDPAFGGALLRERAELDELVLGGEPAAATPGATMPKACPIPGLGWGARGACADVFLARAGSDARIERLAAELDRTVVELERGQPSDGRSG